jgi:hypothetical protein
MRHPALRPHRPGRFAARPTLQEQQPRQVLAGPVGGHHLAGEDLDGGAVRPAVVERNGDGVAGEPKPGE